MRRGVVLAMDVGTQMTAPPRLVDDLFILRDRRTGLAVGIKIEAFGRTLIFDPACPECGEGLLETSDDYYRLTDGLCCRCERPTSLWGLRP